ncbi:MAG: DUF6502 family protein, partial [Janthinobacterium lividum]
VLRNIVDDANPPFSGGQSCERMPRTPAPEDPSEASSGPASQPDRRTLDSATLLGSLTRVLRPLVRLLIRGGVTFPMLSDLLRTLYVEVAHRDLLEPAARTDSRISLLTGVHRKEIRRLRLLPATDVPAPPAVLGRQRIVARWLGTPEYGDADGRPLPLPRTAAEGPSFEALVRSVTTDVRPRAVLEDWLDQGLVRLDAGDRVCLEGDVFLPREDRDGQLFFFARNLHDHIAAAGANLLAAGPAPFIDRSVHYNRLSAGSAARLVKAGREAAQALLLDINRQALSEVAAVPLADGEPTRRVNLGLYLYVEDDEASR